MSEVKMRKKFVKDEKLPIPVFEEPYFSYYLNLYEKLFGARSKYEKFMKNINDIGGWENYFNAYLKLKDNVIEDIKSKDSYAAYLNFDLKEYDITRDYKSNNRSFYITDNSNKKWISIDLKSANFNSLKYVNSSIVNDKNSYKDFLSDYENSNLFVDSKSVRQLIFGNLNPKRQQKIQGYILDKLMKEINIKFNEENLEFHILGSDEFMLEYSENIMVGLVDIIRDFEIETGFKINKKEFEFVKNGENSEFGFIKTYSDNIVEFLGVNKHFHAQAYKKFTGEIILPYDLLFYNENKISTFLEALKN
jgi:hypothetical protein